MLIAKTINRFSKFQSASNHGDYGLMKVSSSTNFPTSDTFATRFFFC